MRSVPVAVLISQYAVFGAWSPAPGMGGAGHIQGSRGPPTDSGPPADSSVVLGSIGWGGTNGMQVASRKLDKSRCAPSARPVVDRRCRWKVVCAGPGATTTLFGRSLSAIRDAYVT